MSFKVAKWFFDLLQPLVLEALIWRSLSRDADMMLIMDELLPGSSYPLKI